MRYILVLLSFLSLSVFANTYANSEKSNFGTQIDQLKSRLYYIEQRVTENNSEIETIAKAVKGNALPLILFAFFCAWWAKSTGRSTLGWFFLGLLFHVLTAIALVSKTESKT